MHHHWNVTDSGLTVSEPTPAPPVAESCARVELEAVVVTKIGVGLAGVGRVVETGNLASQLAGMRVVVPALQPASEKRLAPLIAPVTPRPIPSHVDVEARWLCPVSSSGGPELALLGREAVDAYSMVIYGNIASKTPTLIIGDTAVAQLAAEIALTRSALPALATTNESLHAWAKSRDIHTFAGENFDSLWADIDAAAKEEPFIARPWHILDCAATASSRSLAQRAMTEHTTLALLAGSHCGNATTTGHLDAEHIATTGVEIRGVLGSHPELIPELAEIASAGEINLDQACRITHVTDYRSDAGEHRIQVIVLSPSAG